MREFVNSLDNERIKQLAEQAGAGWDHKYHWYVGSETMQKFAELIVKECVGVADHSNVTGKSIIGQRIKEHFGVNQK
jgi:hypothetical protein